MTTAKKKNSLGVMILKFLLILVLGMLFLGLVLPPLFSIIAPFIQALPFEVPKNYIVTDYIGISVLGLSFVLLLFLAIKWGFR